MKSRGHVFRRVLTICSLLSLTGFASIKPESAAEAVRVDRLAGLCRLWGHVKYFHPALAYRPDIDWDAALVRAIPLARDAETSSEYAAVLQGMLDLLGDPLTCILDGPTPATARPGGGNKELKYELTGDGVLVITAGNYFDLWSPSSAEKIKAAAAAIPKAKAILFDLRSAEPVGDYGRLQLTSSFGQIERLILPAPLLTPGERRRVHHGFESNSAFSSGRYRSGFYTRNGKRIAPAQNAREIPSVFLLNENSALLDSTQALQAGGKALVVFEGEVKHSPVVKTERLDLGEGLSAQVRLVEPILEDGTSGDLRPDATVAADDKGTDLALQTALGLARAFRPSTVAREKLPAVAAPSRDRSYPEMRYPSPEYRLLAAFRIWNVIHYFFPYKRLMGEDWGAVLREFIPKFERAKDALEYSLTVAEMATRIHDSHAYVSGSVLNEHFGTGYPPIRVRLIEDAPVVTHFYDEAIARSAGLEIGDLVLKVDGEDARARLARYAKYISASTPRSNMDKASLSFMNGKAGSLATLTLRDRAGRVKEVKLPRKHEDFTTLYHRERAGDIIKLLPGNIGYADLDRLTLPMVDEMLERFKETRAIIFDMRGYPNDAFWALPQRLTDKRDVAAAFIETPVVDRVSAAESSESFLQTLLPAPPGKPIYKGITVMLIDERSVSQSEHTGMFLRAANGTIFVGSPTAGANGEITSFSAPGGIGIGFSGQSVRFPDGRQLQRVGLVPDVEVRPTVKGIQRGADEVLDKAIEYLRQKLHR